MDQPVQQPSALETFVAIHLDILDASREADSAIERVTYAMHRLLSLKVGLEIARQELGLPESLKRFDMDPYVLMVDRMALGVRNGDGLTLMEDRAKEELEKAMEVVAVLEGERANGNGNS